MTTAREMTSATVLEADDIVSIVWLHRPRPGRHGDPDAELVRLDDRTLGQLTTGNPGWEAEIVLDA